MFADNPNADEKHNRIIGNKKKEKGGLMLSSAESYVPGGKTIRKGLLGGRPSTADPPKLEDVKLDQKDVNSIQDTVWVASTQAQSRLVKRTGQPAIASKMDAAIKLDQKERVIVKQKRPVKKAAGPEVPPPPPPAATAGCDVSVSPSPSPAFQPKLSFAKRNETEVIPVPIIVDSKINTLEQHKRRDDDLSLFAVTIERPHKATNDDIINTPPAANVLAYCSQFKDVLPWFRNMQQVVANSPGLSFQKTPVIRRSVLVTFLRAPDPAMPDERPCCNLDREPMAHENMVRCIAHRLSEKRLGAARAFRLRELLFNDQSLKINAALSHGHDPTPFLSKPPEMCYMCHIWMTTEACLDQKNKADLRDLKDLTSPPPQMYAILNRFMVDVGKPGEYDVRKMLVSDDVSLGIWGPFPLWNERNYVPVRIRTPSSTVDLWGFEESEELLFRLPRVPLQVIESSSASGSIPSNHTPAAPAGTTSRR